MFPVFGAGLVPEKRAKVFRGTDPGADSKTGCVHMIVCKNILGQPFCPHGTGLGDICSDLPAERNEEVEWEYGYFE